MKARIHLSGRLITAFQALVLLAVAGVLFAGTAYFSMRRAVFGREVRVPRVLELELESAREVLAPLELRLESANQRPGCGLFDSWRVAGRGNGRLL